VTTVIYPDLSIRFKKILSGEIIRKKTAKTNDVNKFFNNGNYIIYSS